MSLALANGTFYQDSGAPAVSYTAISVTIEMGNFYMDNTNGNYYICTDASDQAALVWTQIQFV